MERIYNSLICLIVCILCSRNDDIDIWIVAVLILLFNNKRILRWNKSVRNCISSVDCACTVIPKCRCKRIGCCRNNLDIVDVLCYILKFRCVACCRVNLDKSCCLKKLDCSRLIRSIIRNTDFYRFGSLFSTCTECKCAHKEQCCCSFSNKILFHTFPLFRTA